eukprot:6496714-Prymnesium_polylepis.1
MPHSSRPLTSAVPERRAPVSCATPSRFQFRWAPFSRASGARLCPVPARPMIGACQSSTALEEEAKGRAGRFDGAPTRRIALWHARALEHPDATASAAE